MTEIHRIYRDEAFTREEWERREKARVAENQRKFRLRHKDEIRAKNRDWMSARRHGGEVQPRRIGALHSLSCPGGKHRPRKSCRPIPIYDRPVARMGATGVSGESDRLTRGAASVLTPPASRRSSSGVSR